MFEIRRIRIDGHEVPYRPESFEDAEKILESWRPFCHAEVQIKDELKIFDCDETCKAYHLSSSWVIMRP